jgi:hypothetical protein
MLSATQWCDLDSHGFAVVKTSAQLVSCQWWFVDGLLEPSGGLTMSPEVAVPMHRGGHRAGPGLTRRTALET